MSHVFISYSRKDNTFAENLAQAIDNANYCVWKDTRNIEAGDAWNEAIPEAIAKAGLFALLMSSNSNQSDWVKREIIEAQKHKLRILPILLEGEVFFEVAEIEFVDMRGHDGTNLPEKLLNALKKSNCQKQEIKQNQAEPGQTDNRVAPTDVSTTTTSKTKDLPSDASIKKAENKNPKNRKSAQSIYQSLKSCLGVTFAILTAISVILGIMVSIQQLWPVFFKQATPVELVANTEAVTPLSPTTQLIPTTTTAVPSSDETVTELLASPSPEPATPPTAEPSPVSLPLNAENLATWAASQNIRHSSYIETEIAQAQINHLAELTVPEYPTQDWCLNANGETIFDWGRQIGLDEKLLMFVSIHENRLGDLQISDFLNALPANIRFETYAYQQQPLAAYTIFVIVLSSNQNANCYRFP